MEAPSSPKTDFSQTQFDSVLFDNSGSAYVFGHGTGASPATPIQLLAAPCSENPASFVLEANPRGHRSHRHLLLPGRRHRGFHHRPRPHPADRSVSQTTVTMDLSAHPATLFGCPANLASDVANQGIGPGEITLLTGAGLGPAQGI